MVDTYQIHFTNGYNAGAKYRKNWKRAAKLLYQALEESRERIRRLRCHLDDQCEYCSSELQRLRAAQDSLLSENTRLVNEILEMKRKQS